MKRYIFAMAISQQDAKKQIISISSILTEHLIKLYLFPSAEYVDHWKQEIWNFFHGVPKVKSTKKYPSYKLIRYAVGAYEDMIPELTGLVEDSYSRRLAVERDNLSDLENMVSSYFDWISEQLAEQGVVKNSDVYRKLNELGF